MRNLLVVVLFSFVLGTFFSCRYDEDYTTESRLTFSSDMIFFDTIFTRMGSTYQRPTVHNPHDKAILISDVRICGGEASAFRINIDGDTNYHLKNVEIAANDFVHLFVNVTINPQNENSPFLVEDSIEFNVNGAKQYMKLVAFGQDAYYHFPAGDITLPGGSVVQGFYAGCQNPWDSERPHIIYGTCLIEDSVWSVAEGTKIHLGANARIVAGRNAGIKIEGSLENPVIVTGIRKDGHYSRSAGQWDRIWLSGESNNHTIKYAVIENGSTGIVMDSVGSGNVSLEISNTIIRNMSRTGIDARNADITATNLVAAYCNGAVLSIKGQGNYKFTHCTFANYWGSNYWDRSDFRRTPCVKIGDDSGIGISADFLNCIVYGNLYDELSIATSEVQSLLFRNCFLKTSETDADFFKDCIFDGIPLFKDTRTNDLRPADNSPFIGKGIATSVQKDMAGNPWNSPPTIGAYEYMEE